MIFEEFILCTISVCVHNDMTLFSNVSYGVLAVKASSYGCTCRGIQRVKNASSPANHKRDGGVVRVERWGAM